MKPIKSNKIIEYLTEKWQRLDIRKGDTILIHADVKRTMFDLIKEGFKPRIKDIIDSFIFLIGEKGTLMMPNFNFDFSTFGSAFNINNTPSQMGVMSEYFRKIQGVKRTYHPVYSFSVFGHMQPDYLMHDVETAYGLNSPFDVLRKNHGKIILLDVNDQNSMTFYHHIEEMNNVHYRYHKQFTGEYIDSNNNTKVKTYSIFVRNLKQGVKTHLYEAEQLLWDNGIYKGDKPHIDTGVKIANASEMYDFVTENIIKKGLSEGYLYKID